MTSKIVVIGDSGVGKTSLIQVKEIGSMGDQLSTIQPQEIRYKQTFGSTEIEISVWDTPGQYNFRNMVKNFLREAIGFVYTFDVTRHETFDNLDDWYSFVTDTVQTQLIYLVANKVDLEDRREVSNQEASQWAEKHGAIYVETSAKTTMGVKELFSSIANSVYKLPNSPKTSLIVLSNEDNKPKKKKGCCG